MLGEGGGARKRRARQWQHPLLSSSKRSVRWYHRKKPGIRVADQFCESQFEAVSKLIGSISLFFILFHRDQWSLPSDSSRICHRRFPFHFTSLWEMSELLCIASESSNGLQGWFLVPHLNSPQLFSRNYFHQIGSTSLFASDHFGELPENFARLLAAFGLTFYFSFSLSDPLFLP